MKEKIISFYNKHRKYANIALGVLGGIIFISLLWNLVLVKYKMFHDNESRFKKAAMRYYEYRKQALPSKKGEYREITLQQLYDLNQLDDLYIPKSRKLCDNESWVRVYIDEDGEYKYITYLKCGRYHSKGDHTGPEITLNGKNKITITLNSKYEELGVKSVYDNKDKKIDNDKVVIDSSKVNTTKVGTYPVTYTVKDSRFNKTVVTRMVTVSQGLTDTVKNNTGDDGYYKGNSNNYVLFSGMLWKVINVNDDGTVRIILNQPITSLRMNYDSYKDSNAHIWLNNVFYKVLHDADKHVVEKSYCVGSINSMNDYSNFCSESINTKVALLDIDSYYKTIYGGTTSIYSKNFALANKIGNNYGEATFTEDIAEGTPVSILSPIRPVITLKNKEYIMSGDGSYSKPYKLDDYKYANKNAKLNTRLVGEYVEYSGLIFRIIGKDENKNVRLIMDNKWVVKPDDTPIFIEPNNVEKWNFDLEDENNPAFIMNNDYLDYISTKNIVDTEYEVPINDLSKTYDKYEVTKIKAKVVLPKTYELFATSGSTESMYTYIDRSTNDQMLFATNTKNARVFEIGKEDFASYVIKAIITVKGDLKIESGKGTVNSPYKLK